MTKPMLEPEPDAYKTAIVRIGTSEDERGEDQPINVVPGIETLELEIGKYADFNVKICLVPDDRGGPPQPLIIKTNPYQLDNHDAAKVYSLEELDANNFPRPKILLISNGIERKTQFLTEQYSGLLAGTDLTIDGLDVTFAWTLPKAQWYRVTATNTAILRNLRSKYLLIQRECTLTSDSFGKYSVEDHTVVANRSTLKINGFKLSAVQLEESSVLSLSSNFTIDTLVAKGGNAKVLIKEGTSDNHSIDELHGKGFHLNLELESETSRCKIVKEANDISVTGEGYLEVVAAAAVTDISLTGQRLRLHPDSFIAQASGECQVEGCKYAHLSGTVANGIEITKLDKDAEGAVLEEIKVDLTSRGWNILKRIEQAQGPVLNSVSGEQGTSFAC